MVGWWWDGGVVPNLRQHRPLDDLAPFDLAVSVGVRVEQAALSGEGVFKHFTKEHKASNVTHDRLHGRGKHAFGDGTCA